MGFGLFKFGCGGNSVCYGGGGNDGGGGGSSTQTVQKADPWAGQQPYLTTGFAQAQTLLDNNGPVYYPGSTVASYSPDTQLALQMQANRALNGSPVQSAATSQLTSTLNGNYLQPISDAYHSPTMTAANQLNANTLNGNYLYGGDGFNAALQAASDKILPQVNSQFNMAGRTGSGLAATAQTQALADAFASQYGQERNNQMQASNQALQNTNSEQSALANERTNQLRGMYFAPTIANQDYTDISNLGQAGAQQDSYNQSLLNDQINRYNYAQNLPQAKLADYMNTIQGNYGGTTSSLSNSTQSQPSYSNDFASGLGGILSVASLFGGGGGGGLLGGLGLF